MENNGKFLQVLIFILCAGLLALSVYTYRSISTLHDENLAILEKLDSVQAMTAAIPITSAAAPAQASPRATQSKAGSLIDEIFSDLEKEYKASKKESARTAKTPKITVSSSYRIEDRYVSYKLYDPEYLGDQEGKVIVNISVDKYGKVKKTSINEASSITDEEVLDSARKAALKTDFNFDTDKKELQEGTITYTFARK